MSSRGNRILDRFWLALSGAGLLAITLQAGAQIGARRWSIDAVLAAQAAPAPPSGCRDEQRVRGLGAS
jgi:hypothetical protein